MLAIQKCENCYRFYRDMDLEEDDFDGYCLRTTLAGIASEKDEDDQPSEVIPPQRVSLDFHCEDYSRR